MCGIAGSFGSYKPSDEVISKTLSCMKRRGPDDQSFWQKNDGNNFVTFLHSRLAILDLDPRSNQPFHVEQASLSHASMVFNGEIYNYVELRKNLLAQGISLKTESDTEVLLHYYIIYGEACFKYFEGMWVCAIYNHQSKEIIFSRDRFGEKPLLWTKCGDTIFFGSQTSFIESLSQKKLEVNTEKVTQFLTAGFRSIFKDNHTYFKDVHLVPHGTNVIFSSDGNIRHHRYFTPEVLINEDLSREDAISGIRERLIKSVELRLRSDVPLAYCLSGGVDSGALISIAKKIFNADVHAFSIIDYDERYNEIDLINETIKDTKARHTIKKVSHDGFFERMKSLIKYHDSPLATISYYVHSMLSESIAANGFKVAFSGSGADELFSGYYDHYLLHIAELSDSKKAISDWETWVKPIVRNPAFQDPLCFVNAPDERGYIYQDQDLFASLLKDKKIIKFSEENFCNNKFRNRMLNELFHEIIPVIMWEDDLNSMYYSIENRSPFLDTELLTFACTIPPRMLIEDGYGKVLLREALKGILNEPVRTCRQKKGFNASINSLVNFSDPEVIKSLTNDSPIFDIVDRDKITSFFKQQTNNSESKFLFSFISAKIFLELRAGV